MKRLALALLGGFIIPIVYAIIAAPLSTNVTNPTLDYLLMLPVRWPILILFRFGVVLFVDEIAILVFLVVCNVCVYSILSYFLLWKFFKPKKRAVSLPPEPPSFARD